VFLSLDFVHVPKRLEIPHGPCASFGLPDGRRAALYELVRPEAATHFDGRIDG